MGAPKSHIPMLKIEEREGEIFFSYTSKLG